MELNERIAALETLQKVIIQNQEDMKARIIVLETEQPAKSGDHFKWLSAVMLGMVVMIKEVRQALGDIIGRLLP